jgi:hypothetical protein
LLAAGVVTVVSLVAVSFVGFATAVVVGGGASESELSPELVPELSLKMLFILDLSTAVELAVGVDVVSDFDVAFDDDVVVNDDSGMTVIKLGKCYKKNCSIR